MYKFDAFDSSFYIIYVMILIQRRRPTNMFAPIMDAFAVIIILITLMAEEPCLPLRRDQRLVPNRRVYTQKNVYLFPFGQKCESFHLV